ncbi:MAG: non-ribosomal peptide synthetase, partial [bacterium]|nr:non-ribosomal peptide synthetase [bacterium]
KKEYYPLTPTQQRMYILHRMEHGAIGYNMPCVYRLEKKTDPEKLEKAFRQLIQRHETLRTTFHIVKEEPVQRIHTEANFNLEKYEIKENHQTPGAGPELEGYVYPFDLDATPLLRAGIIKTTTGRSYLFTDVHHIVSDGISMEILQEELSRFYENTTAGLPPLKIQYKDFARWWKEEKTGDKIRQQKKYWQEKYTGEIPVLNLPIDFTRPAVRSFEGNTLDFTLEPEKTKKLEQMAAKEKTTLYMLLLSLYYILLSKLSGQQEIITGTPVAGRTHPDVEPLIGMFVNTLPLRNHINTGKTFPGLLKNVSTNTLEAFENQEYQLEDLVQHLEVERDASRNPLFDVMFVLQNTTAGHTENHTETKELRLKPLKYYSDIAKFDITLSVAQYGQQLDFELEYSTKLFKEENIKRFIRYFKKIVHHVLQEPLQKIHEI